jgi:hypothetical protein
LWSNGHAGHLDVDTCAGKAWVGLHVNLGHPLGHLHRCQPHPAYQNHKKVDSPSRQRRRASRAAARAQQVHAEEALDPATVEETIMVENVEETLSDKDTIETVSSLSVDDQVNENNDDLLNENHEIEVGKDLH